jgi:peptide/nickel transport system permease protein
MIFYIIRRVIAIIPTLLLVSMIVFFVVRLIPGDVIDLMLAEQGSISWESDEALKKKIQERLGLDVAIHVQFVRWLNGIFLHGDLGTSLWRDTPVTKEIIARVPVTLELGILGLLTSMLISFPIGIYSALRQDSVGDYIGRTFAIGCIAVPSFWLGTMVVVFPSIWWELSPPIIYTPITEDLNKNLAHVAIPGVILGMGLSGVIMRMVRTMVLEVLRQDYIRTAWAKGLRERAVIIRHAMKNALIPVVTLIGLMFPVIVSGSVVLEQIFTLPGMGRLLFEAAMNRDYTIISGVVMIIAVAILFINLFVDILYAYLDPRVRYR